jgi:hypothetical protein
MLRQITARQFAEWLEYMRMEPFSTRRSDLQTALICQTMANPWRPKEQKKPYTLQDFMLRYDGETAKKRPQTWQEKKSIAYMIAAAYAAPRKQEKKPKKAA